MKWLGLYLIFAVGCFIGWALCCFCHASARADRHLDGEYHE